MSPEKPTELQYGLIVAAIAFIVYANSLFNGFTLDDNSVILNNPVLKGDILSLFKSIDTNNDAQPLPFYRPVTYLTYMLEGRLHGFNPFFIRLFNVLLHSANSFLVFRLVRTLNRDHMYVALLAGLLFAVHPLHTEGVDFNSGGRNTMLACFFSISAYLVQSRSIIQQKTYYSLIGAALFLMGLFCKETALMIFPFIVALQIAIMRRNNHWTILQTSLRLVPYISAAAIYIFMRWATLSPLGLQQSVIPGLGAKLIESRYVTPDLATRLLNNLYIIPHYFLTIINPTTLSSRYMIPDDLNLLLLPLVAAWLCIIIGLAWLLFKGRTISTLFGLSWCILFWLPVSGIVFVPGAPLADRFLYIPAIGIWIIVADRIVRLVPDNNANVRKYCAITIVSVLLLLAALTIRRNMDWKNNITLHTRFVEQYPENVHARSGLGIAYYVRRQNNDLDLAEKEFEKVLSLDPFFPKAHTALGVIKLEKNDYSGALRHFGEALAIFPYDTISRINRGITYEKLGRTQEALQDYIYFLSTPSVNKSTKFRLHAEEKVRELSK